MANEFTSFNGHPVEDAVAREKIELLSNYVTPQMFGAVGDGVTDDTNAFLQALENSDFIFIPKGTYIISQPLTISSFKHLYGENWSSSIIKYTGEEFLFTITSSYAGKPLIENLYFSGSETNKFLTCNRGSWGGSVQLRDVKIYGFDALVFLFVSAYNTIVENAVIVSDGQTQFRTFDGTVADTNFNNHIIFRNVYFNLTERGTLIDMFNVRRIYFIECTLEHAAVIFNATNKTQGVIVERCWIEDNDLVYQYDDTSSSGFTNANNNIVLTTKVYDKTFEKRNDSVYNYNGSNADTLMALLTGDQTISLHDVATNNPNDSYSAYQRIFHVGSDYTAFMSPLNMKKAIFNDVTEFSFDLKTVANYSSVGVLHKIHVLRWYEDASWVFSEFIILQRQNKSFLTMKENVINSSKWEGSGASLDTGSYTLSSGTFKYTGDQTMSFALFMDEFNILGKTH